MKKPALTLLAIAVPLIAVLVLWFALGSSDRSARGEATPATSATPVPEPPALERAPELALAAAPIAATEVAAPGDSTPPVQREAASEGGGRRLAGHVAIPGGAPADDSLRVLALEKELDPRHIYGNGGVLADLAAGKKERALGTAAVAPDGTFELALASEADVWLALDGRFLYSAHATRAAAGEKSVELAAEIGGCLAGRVTLPGGSVDAAAFAELEVELDTDGQNFSMASAGSPAVFERRAKPDGDGRFELRALPTGVSQALVVHTSAFAKARVGSLQFEPAQVRALEIALVVGATLSGVVRDESGAPVADARVKAAENGIFGFPGRELADTKSDANGAFALAHVGPGKCMVLAEKDGFLQSEALKLEPHDLEQRGGLALELSHGASISGRVKLPEGAPAASAKVDVSFDPEAMNGMGALNAARGGQGHATAGEDGRFEVTGLGKGPFVVVANVEHTAADGVKETWRARTSAVKPDTRDLELTVAPSSALAGKVQDLAGKPVTKFVVRATQQGAAFFMPTETRQVPCEDPEGDFVMRGLDAGKWKLDASADGFGPIVPLDVVVPRSEADPLVLVLSPAASISGTVTDPSGKPLGGARVSVHVDLAQRIQRMSGKGTGPETQSGEGGVFLLTGLAPGTNSIEAEHDGFAASDVASVETSAEAPAQGVALRLRKGALVTGEVYGRDTKPLAGAQIIAQEPATQTTAVTRSDGAGQFRFEHVAPGTWTITALLEGGDAKTEGSASEVSASFLENMRFAMVTLEDGEEEHVVLGAPPKNPVLVHGTVRHADRPVGDGLVSFVAEGTKGLEALKMVALSPDGRYETQLTKPGRYLVTVQITATGGAFQQHNVEYNETIPEAAEHVLDFTLPLGAVRGTVHVSGRDSQAGTRVTLGSDGGIDSGTMMGGQYSEATTDENGHYSFDYLRPGTYAVAAGGALMGGAFGNPSHAGRLVRAGLHVEEGRALDDVNFTLDEPGDIKGRVLDVGGTPVKEAAIFVRDGHGQLLERFSMIASGADGTFTYTGVAPGEYIVSARGKATASEDSASVRVEKGGTASVELTVRAGTRLVIEVVDDAGAPLRARVSVVDSHGREMEGMLGWADIMGGFAENGFDTTKQNVGPLPPGSYTVTATAADGKKSSKSVALDGQPERRLKVRLH